MNTNVYRLPDGFGEKIRQIYPQNYQHIINSFAEKKVSSFRINYLKTDLVSLRKQLVEEKVRFKELQFPAGAFLLNMPMREFQQREVYNKGKVYVQNISSMLPVLMLEPRDGETILDLCAAPGTKTTQIVSLAPKAEVTAIEKDRIRFYKLLANLKIQGAESVNTMLIDGIWVRKKFPEYFDKILVDAPCSAEGRFLLTDPRSYKYWKERKVKEMMHKQKKLMHAAFFALKEGGTLVYSTCTFSPEENECVVEWFLDKFSGKVELLPMELPLANAVPGMRGWNSKHFEAPMRLTRRILPNDFMEGFFVAKIKKTAV